MNRLQTLLENKHTTGAAIAYLIATGIEEVGPVWAPSYHAALVATAKWLKGAAFVWGMIAAKDAGPATPVDKPPDSGVKPQA